MGNSDDKEKVVHQPLEHGLKTIEDIFTANEKILKELNPISTVSITTKEKNTVCQVITDSYMLLGTKFI